MHGQQVVDGGRPRRDHLQARPQVGLLEVGHDRRRPVGRLDVGAGVVLGVDRVPDDRWVHARSRSYLASQSSGAPPGDELLAPRLAVALEPVAAGRKEGERGVVADHDLQLGLERALRAKAPPRARP